MNIIQPKVQPVKNGCEIPEKLIMNSISCV